VLDLEASLLEDASEILRGLELLEASSPKLKTLSTITCACFFIASIWPVRSALMAASLSGATLGWARAQVAASKARTILRMFLSPEKTTPRGSSIRDQCTP